MGYNKSLVRVLRKHKGCKVEIGCDNGCREVGKIKKVSDGLVTLESKGSKESKKGSTPCFIVIDRITFLQPLIDLKRDKING